MRICAYPCADLRLRPSPSVSVRPSIRPSVAGRRHACSYGRMHCSLYRTILDTSDHSLPIAQLGKHGGSTRSAGFTLPLCTIFTEMWMTPLKTVCIYTSLITLKPSEPFLFAFFKCNKDFSGHAIEQEILPVWSTAYLALLPPLSMLSELVGHRTVVFIGAVGRLLAIALLLLPFSTNPQPGSLLLMQLSQVLAHNWSRSSRVLCTNRMFHSAGCNSRWLRSASGSVSLDVSRATQGKSALAANAQKILCHLSSAFGRLLAGVICSSSGSGCVRRRHIRMQCELAWAAADFTGCSPSSPVRSFWNLHSSRCLRCLSLANPNFSQLESTLAFAIECQSR